MLTQKQEDILRLLPPIDYNDQYLRNQGHGIILNDYDFATEGFSDLIRNSVFHTSSDIDFVATCKCEHLKGNSYIGITCPICHTKVQQGWDSEHSHLFAKNWVSCPYSIPNGWLNPRVFIMLRKWMSHQKGETSSYLEDILDPSTEIPYEISHVVKGKGFTYLYNNFDRIMAFFLDDFKPTARKSTVGFVRIYLKMWKDRIWCKYVPLANDALHPILSSEGTEKTKKHYSDTRADSMLRAISGLSRLKFKDKKRERQSDVDRTTYRAYMELIQYRDDLTDLVADGKKALPRSHMVGARLHQTFRTVITPIPEPHNMDELWMPWKLLVNTEKVSIYNILMHEYNMSLNTAVRRHLQSLMQYDELIHKIVDRLIDESPFPGLPTLWHRPPTIREGSIMTLFISRVKTDLYDQTVSTSPPLAKLPNFDETLATPVW